MGYSLQQRLLLAYCTTVVPLMLRFISPFYIYKLNYLLGLLRLQQIYQSLTPGSQTIRVETVKRIANASTAIEFLKTLEKVNRWTRKFIVLDCPSDMAKEIVVSHVRDVSLGRRTYHYLLSDLVSISHSVVSPVRILLAYIFLYCKLNKCLCVIVCMCEPCSYCCVGKKKNSTVAHDKEHFFLFILYCTLLRMSLLFISMFVVTL